MMYLKTFWALLRRLFRSNKVADYTKASIAEPLVITDKVMYAKTFTLSPTNSIGTKTIDINISDTIQAAPGLLPFGLYTYDGGTTWNEISASSSSALDTVLSVILGAEFRNDVIRFGVRVAATVGAGATIPIQVYLGLIDIPFGSPEYSGPDFNKTSFLNLDVERTEQKASYDSRFVAPRIHKLGVVPQDGTIYTIPHGLASVPDIRPFEYYVPDNLVTPPVGPTVHHPTSFKVDSTNLYINTITNIANSYFGYIIYLPND